MINPIVKTIELPDGRTITLETGKLAKQADGSVMLRMGNTMLLATVCAAKDAVPGTDFMPLQVEPFHCADCLFLLIQYKKNIHHLFVCGGLVGCVYIHNFLNFSE